jgi:ATP-dependent DNA ligase
VTVDGAEIDGTARPAAGAEHVEPCLRSHPLAERKARLAKLVGRSDRGIVYNEHTDEDGATVFRHACKLGLEGIVSKRLTASYRSGPSRDWIKVKNPDSPAMVRHREGRWE